MFSVLYLPMMDNIIDLGEPSQNWMSMSVVILFKYKKNYQILTR